MKNSLKSILISFKKKRLLSVMRLTGLIVGFTVAFYLFGIITTEKSYDKFWNGADRMYRVALNQETKGELVSSSARNFNGAPHLLKAEIPGIESACAFGKDIITVFAEEKQFNEVRWLWSDTTFFKVFDRKILMAESNDYFGDLHGVVISSSFANKLYGSKNPIGEKFKLNEGWEFIVKAVFEDIPANSHLSADVIGSYGSLFYYMANFDLKTRTLVENPNYKYTPTNPYQTSAWSWPITYRPYCYIKLANNTNIQSVINQVPTALEKVKLPNKLVDSKLHFIFQNVQDIHLNSALGLEFQANGSSSKVLFLSITAIVVLLICAINYINLTTINTIENGKQFAVRIINGAKHSSILWLLMIENLVIGIGSFLTANLFYLAISYNQTNLTINPIILFELGLFILLISIPATVIPYYTAIKGRQHAYLKSQTGTLPGMWNGRKILVIFQFSITTILIIGTILINKQIAFMTNYELAFKPEATLFSYSPMSMNNREDIGQRLLAFQNEILAVPGVNSFAVSSSVPGKEISRTIDKVRIKEGTETVLTNFNLMSISNKYLDVFGIELLAGRNFTDQGNWTSQETIISKSAAEKLGYKNPADAIGNYIGLQNGPCQIVGVLNDYHHLSLKSQIVPLILVQDLTWDYAVGYYSINFNPERTKDVLAAAARIWQKIYPGEIAAFNFTDQTFAAQYDTDQKFNRLLSLGSFIALLISCIGLFAISSFDTQKRRREVGIRKVNGARIGEIIFLLNNDIMKWVSISFLLAVPGAWYAGQRWLEGFAYKTEISWWIFLLGCMLALGIALLTVSWQSWKAAKRNPVEALRSE